MNRRSRVIHIKLLFISLLICRGEGFDCVSCYGLGQSPDGPHIDEDCFNGVSDKRLRCGAGDECYQSAFYMTLLPSEVRKKAILRSCGALKTVDLGSCNATMHRKLAEFSFGRYYNFRTDYGTTCLCTSDACNNNDWDNLITGNFRDQVDVSTKGNVDKENMMKNGHGNALNGKHPYTAISTRDAISMVTSENDAENTVMFKYSDGKTSTVGIVVTVTSDTPDENAANDTYPNEDKSTMSSVNSAAGSCKKWFWVAILSILGIHIF